MAAKVARKILESLPFYVQFFSHLILFFTLSALMYIFYILFLFFFSLCVSAEPESKLHILSHISVAITIHAFLLDALNVFHTSDGYYRFIDWAL